MTWPDPPTRDQGGAPALEPAAPPSEPVSSGSLTTFTGGQHPSGLVATDIQVRPVASDRLRAWVTITFNDAFVIKGIRIIQGNSRLFVAMPSRQQKDGSYQDVAHPIHKDFRIYLEELILEAYHSHASN